MLRLFAALFVTFAASPVLAGATAWQDIAPGVKARLISSDVLTDGRSMAGLELVMPPGTKTYWRIPGETGIPTEFDFAASTGIAAPTPHWPFPEIDTSQGFMDYVYHGTVVLPVEFEAEGEGTILDMAVTLGICSDICVPVMAEFNLPLNFAAPDTAQSIRLDQAMATTPILWDQPGEPLSVVTLGPSGLLYIEAPNPLLDPAHFIADVGDPSVLFETPQKSPDGTVWSLKPLGGADTKGLEGSPVQLTFLTPMGPYAVSRTIVSSDPA
jgi:DsbC/DsbD-like thiol-disulfide interchange protein